MSLRIFTMVLCLIGLAVAGPLHAEEEADSDTQRLLAGLDHAKVGDYEKARTAFRNALELDDDVDRSVCLSAASLMYLCGEAGLAAELLQVFLQDAENWLEAFEFLEPREGDETKIKKMKETKREWEAMMAKYERTALLEEKVRKETAPMYVASVIRSVTRHRKSISTKYLQFEEEEQGYALKDEFSTLRWVAAARVAKDGRTVTHTSIETWLGRDAVWARFDVLLKLLKAQTGTWKRSFAATKEWPDVECEAWMPPKLPFPEGGMRVLRRVEFRWTTKKDKAPPSESIATLSIFRPPFELEDGSETYGGSYILELGLTSKDFR